MALAVIDEIISDRKKFECDINFEIVISFQDFITPFFSTKSIRLCVNFGCFNARSVVERSILCRFAEVRAYLALPRSDGGRWRRY